MKLTNGQCYIAVNENGGVKKCKTKTKHTNSPAKKKSKH